MSYDPHQPPPTRRIHPQQYQVPAVPSSPPVSPVPYGHPYPPPPQQFVVTPPVPTSGWAAAALVLGLLGALGGWCLLGLPCLVAIVAGHIGLNDTRDASKGGRGLAVTGLILGYVFVVPWALFFFMGGLGTALTAVTPTVTPTP